MSNVYSKMTKDRGHNLIFEISFNSGHLTGCGGADLHSSLTSTSSASSEHFQQKKKKKKLPYINSDKVAALTILTNITAEDIDYFEAVFLLNIDKSTPLRSQAIFIFRACVFTRVFMNL